MHPDERDLDPRFRDPSRFPCGVVGCEERAAGWIAALHVPVTWFVHGEGDRLYACEAHLREALPAWEPHGTD